MVEVSSRLVSRVKLFVLLSRLVNFIKFGIKCKLRATHIFTSASKRYKLVFIPAIPGLCHQRVWRSSVRQGSPMPFILQQEAFGAVTCKHQDCQEGSYGCKLVDTCPVHCEIVHNCKIYTCMDVMCSSFQLFQYHCCFLSNIQIFSLVDATKI